MKHIDIVFLIIILLLVVPIMSDPVISAFHQDEEIIPYGKVVDEKPILIGGYAAIDAYIEEHDLFPKLAREASVSGKVMIGFIIGTDGVPYDFNVGGERPPGLGFGDAGIKVMRAMRFTPGKLKGRSVRVRMKQPIAFSSDLMVEKKPILIGGETAIAEYIVEHELFPEVARETGVSGEVMLDIFVDIDGVAQEILVAQERPQGLGFGEAAVIVMKGMRFQTENIGRNNFPVKMYRTITFRLELMHRIAINDFTKAIESNPKDSDAYYNRGLAYLQLGQNFSARQDFVKAKELGHTKAQDELDNLDVWDKSNEGNW